MNIRTQLSVSPHSSSSQLLPHSVPTSRLVSELSTPIKWKLKTKSLQYYNTALWLQESLEKKNRSPRVCLHQCGVGFNLRLTLTDKCLSPPTRVFDSKQSGESWQPGFVETARQYTGVSVHMSHHGLQTDSQFALHALHMACGVPAWHKGSRSLRNMEETQEERLD